MRARWELLEAIDDDDQFMRLAQARTDAIERRRPGAHDADGLPRRFFAFYGRGNQKFVHPGIVTFLVHGTGPSGARWNTSL